MQSTLSLLDYAVEAVSQLLTTPTPQRQQAGVAKGAERRGQAPYVGGDGQRTIGTQRAARSGAGLSLSGVSSAQAQPSIYFAIPLELEAVTG